MNKLTLAQILAEAHAERMAAVERAIKSIRQPSEAEKAAREKAIQSISEQIKKAKKP